MASAGPTYPGIRPDVQAEADRLGLDTAAVVRASKFDPVRAISRQLGQLYAAPPEHRAGILRDVAPRVRELGLAADAARASLDRAIRDLGLGAEAGPVLVVTVDAPGPRPDAPDLSDDELDALTRPGPETTEDAEPDADAE